MSSQRRIASSRANGAKSRGPKTPEGKLRSSQNSTRHGLLAESIVLAEEDATAFVALVASLEDTFQPADAFEDACVETMAVARWRIMRIWQMEAVALQHEIRKGFMPHEDPRTRAALAFQNLCDSSNSSDLMSRYESRYDHQFARAFRNLLKWRMPNEPNPINGHSPDPSPAPENPLKSPDISDNNASPADPPQCALSSSHIPDTADLPAHTPDAAVETLPDSPPHPPAPHPQNPISTTPGVESPAQARPGEAPEGTRRSDDRSRPGCGPSGQVAARAVVSALRERNALVRRGQATATLKGLIFRNEIGGTIIPGVAIQATGANHKISGNPHGGFILEFPNQGPGEKVKPPCPAEISLR